MSIQLLQIGTTNKKKYVILDKATVESLHLIPDGELKIKMASILNPRYKDEDIAQFTGEDVALVEKVRGEESKKKEVVVKKDTPFVPKDALKSLASSDKKRDRILALYWVIKELKIDSRSSYKQLFSPLNLRYSKVLEIYDLDTLKEAMVDMKRYADEKQFEWGLHHIEKSANRIANT